MSGPNTRLSPRTLFNLRFVNNGEQLRFVDNPEASWPLEPGERLLWEGAPDPAPTKAARRAFIRCVLYAIILVLLAAYMLALLLSSNVDGFVEIHTADP